MTFKTPFRLSLIVSGVLAFAGVAAAQGTVFNTTSTTSNLAASATVQTALNLVISADAAGVTPGGTLAGGYTLAFGNVNGLGLGTPSANVTATALSGNAGYIYTTPITLTPNFSGFTTDTATITVEESSSDSAPSQAAAREGATAAISATTVPLVGGTPTTVAAAAADGVDIQRFIGVVALRGNNAANANAGARSINLVYTISVP